MDIFVFLQNARLLSVLRLSFLQITFAAFLGMLFLGCSEDVNSVNNGLILYPSRNESFSLYPNDAARHDSAAANLSRGIALQVSPGASYSLSFDIDENTPVPELQLFRTYEKNGLSYYQQARRLSGIRSGTRVSYTFICEESKAELWYTSLVGSDNDYFLGTVKNVKYEGEGAYSSNLSLNLIVVGKYSGTLDSISVDSLAHRIKEAFEEYYKINLDTVYVSSADSHPSAGENYPASKLYVVPYNTSSNPFGSLVTWPDLKKSNALDLALVHRIGTDLLLGFSPVFGVSMAENGYAVVLATHYSLNTEVNAISSEDIVTSAMHEMGHFFGLRHTTSTKAELILEGDYSMYEDGLEDTDVCTGLAAKKEADYNIDMITDALPYVANRNVPVYVTGISCPDAVNMMYPYAGSNQTFSAGQLEIVNKNLKLLVH